MDFKAPYLPYEKLRLIAADFLKQYNPNGDIPVDIESIVEFDLNLNIQSLPGLRENYNTEAFLSKDRKTIYVDSKYFEQKNLFFRYRFTLAHEVGHYILHDQFYKKAIYSNVDEWRQLIKSIPESEYSWFERHAYNFAGLILVPDDNLEQYFDEAKSKLAGTNIDQFNKEQLLNWITQWIGQNFYNVSNKVIEKRLERNGLSI